MIWDLGLTSVGIVSLLDQNGNLQMPLWTQQLQHASEDGIIGGNHVWETTKYEGIGLTLIFYCLEDEGSHDRVAQLKPQPDWVMYTLYIQTGKSDKMFSKVFNLHRSILEIK